MKWPCRWILAAGFLLGTCGWASSAGFTLSGATVAFTDPTTLSVDSDVTLASGSLNAGNAAIQVSGNWTESGGTFAAGTSTVTFQGTASSTFTFTGSTAFYSLQNTAPGQGLLFQAGSTQTVTGSLLLLGSAGHLTRIRSSIPGSSAYLVNTGTNSVSFVNVQDNNATGGVAIRAGTNSVNAGDTLNWSFGEPAPSAPTISTVYSSSITVHWGAVNTLTGYSVEASTASDFTGTVFSSVTISTSATTLTVGEASALTVDTTYFVRVGALYNGTTNYASTSPSSTSTLTGPIANLQVAQVFVTSITVNWTALGMGQGYRMDVSTSPSFAPLAGSSTTASINVTTLTVAGLSAFTTYYVRVGGLNWNRVLNFDAPFSTQTIAGGPPGTPQISAVFANRLTVAWSAAANSTGYEVDASTANDFMGTVFSSNTANSLLTALTVGAASSLAFDTTYYLRVGALYNGATTFANTPTLSTATLTAPITGAEIAQVFASSVTVNWAPLGAGQSYELDASTSSDFFPLAGSSTTIDLSVSTLTISGLSNNVAYFLRVGGLNWNGIANFSLVGAATTGVGVAPDNPLISAVFTSSITAAWTDVSNTSGYEIDASTAEDFTGNILSSVTANTNVTSLTIGMLVPLTVDTTYFMRIGALFNGATSFINTEPSSLSTLTQPISGSQIAQVFATSITVTWPALGAAQGYQLDASTASDFSGTLYSSMTEVLSLNALTVTSLTAGTTYFLRVGGINWDNIANSVSVGSIRTTPGPAPLNPTIVLTLVNDITVNWGSVNSDNGYSLEASTASNFSGDLFLSSTTDGSATTLILSGLGPNTTYYLRVGSLWNGATNYALTTPASTTTLTVLTFGTPERPAEITGAFTSFGDGFILSWRSVTTNTSGQTTTIGHYVIERSPTVTGPYINIAGVFVSSLTYTDAGGQIFYYRVRAADMNNNLSEPSDIIDSSPPINRYIIASDNSETRLVLPSAIAVELLAEHNNLGDVDIQITRRSQDETSDVLKSYDISARQVATDDIIPNFAFSQTMGLFLVDYFSALAGSPAIKTNGTNQALLVAPFWLNGASAIQLVNSEPASNQPFSSSIRNSGIYQIRLAASSDGDFELLPGSPYPRVLTPNRVNENRRLFFFFKNPSNTSVEATIYDVRGAKVRDLTASDQGPSVNSLVWDVKNSRGGIVPGGIYVYKLKAGSKTITGTVVVAR